MVCQAPCVITKARHHSSMNKEVSQEKSVIDYVNYTCYTGDYDY